MTDGVFIRYSLLSRILKIRDDSKIFRQSYKPRQLKFSDGGGGGMTDRLVAN